MNAVPTEILLSSHHAKADGHPLHPCTREGRVLNNEAEQATPMFEAIPLARK